MLRIKSTFVLLSLLLFSLSSCINNLDFDQVDELDFTTPIRLSFINFELTQEDYFDESNNVVSFISDESVIRISEIASHSDTESIVIETNFTNTFNTDIVLELSYYTDSNELLSLAHSIVVPQNNEDYSYELVIDETDFNEFLSAKKIHVTTILNDPGSVYPLQSCEFTMNSTFSIIYKY